MKFFGGFFFILSLISGNVFSDDDVFGGKEVPEGHQISQVVVGLTRGSDYICSAVVLNKHFILTAGHCVQLRMNVEFGRTLFLKENPIRSVQDFRIHPEFNSGQMNVHDIALLKIEGEILEGFKGADLFERTKLKRNQKVFVAGFGSSDPLEQQGFGVLRFASVKVGLPWYGPFEFIVNQNQGSGACAGDSGGAAFVKRGKRLELIGLTSRISPLSSSCSEQVAFTKLSAYKDWIMKAMDEMTQE